jgi:hypothetical protein
VKSDVLRGWKDNGVGDRIEKFLTAGGVEKVLTDVDGQWKGVIHGDFSTYCYVQVYWIRGTN